MLADLGDKSDDAAALAALAEIAARNNDARAMLLLGKTALGRGCRSSTTPSRPSAFPNYPPIGPPVEPARGLCDRAAGKRVQPAHRLERQRAMGLMQVTPAAGKLRRQASSRRRFDQKRLLSDQAYNVQLGAAELGDVIEDYRGSYILAFAAYNAGRGRVKDWIAQIRRSARSQGRSDRLGRAHPVLGDAQLRAARAGEHAGLSRALRRRLQAADRGRPAPRRRRELMPHFGATASRHLMGPPAHRRSERADLGR